LERDLNEEREAKEVLQNTLDRREHERIEMNSELKAQQVRMTSNSLIVE